MATLHGESNRHLSITPIQYQFPDPELRTRLLEKRNQERGGRPRAVFTRWDANWLLVRVAASDEHLDWSLTEPTFLTWELRSLVEWLRRAADAISGEAHPFYTSERGLELQGRSLPGGAIVEALLDSYLHPRTLGLIRSPEPYTIEFVLADEELRSFATALEQEMERFPVREWPPSREAG